MGHTYLMLTTKGSTAKVEKAKTVKEIAPDASWDDVLKFASENQRLEGFPGEISEAARQYRPDMEHLKEVSKKFGAQIPRDPAKG